MGLENQILEIIVLLLIIATLVGLVSRRLRLPYTVGLVLMGLLLGFLNRPGQVAFPAWLAGPINQAITQVTPALILGLLVTPLIFEAAFHLRWEGLRQDLGLILALAVPGVLLTTLLVGGIVYVGTGLPLLAALVFGALISATDPVSVIALFRTLGVPSRLQVVLEGESLLNDGTAIVTFAVVLSLAQAAAQPSGAGAQTAWLLVPLEFVRVAGGGLLVGLASGWLASEIIRNTNDYLLETTLTTVLAFGAYIAAELLGVSGVLAVVGAGLMCGNLGPRGMSPTGRMVITNFWEYAAFIANSFVFLLIGMEMDLAELTMRWQPILLAILAVLIARAVVVYGLAWTGVKLPLSWRHVLFWGGLRGAISLALALGLPAQLGAETGGPLRAMAFGVVLFTILVQGFSMQPLVQRLNLVQRSAAQAEFERRQARAVSAQAAYQRIQQLYQDGLLSQHSWQIMAPLLEQRAQVLADAVKEVLRTDPRLEADEIGAARREALRAQRGTLRGLLAGGVISEEVYAQLKGEVDMALTENANSFGQSRRGPADPGGIRRLTMAVIQLQDVENAMSALNKAGLAVTRLPSTGGFLGRRNVTLLIGMPEGQEEAAIRILSKSCHRRVEYVATPLEGAPFPLPLSTPINVGGATIFTLEVERYEEI